MPSQCYRYQKTILQRLIFCKNEACVNCGKKKRHNPNLVIGRGHLYINEEHYNFFSQTGFQEVLQNLYVLTFSRRTAPPIILHIYQIRLETRGTYFNIMENIRCFGLFMNMLITYGRRFINIYFPSSQIKDKKITGIYICQVWLYILRRKVREQIRWS